jgi:hypothetical protein
MARWNNIDTGGKNIILITQVNFLTQASCQIKEKNGWRRRGKIMLLFPPMAIFAPQKEGWERDLVIR